MSKQFNCGRFMYNLALETKAMVYNTRGIILSDYELMKQITDLKKDAPWLKEVDLHSLRQDIIDLGNAYNKFFSGCGFPKFRKKTVKQSFKSPRLVKVDFKKSTITSGRHKDIVAVIKREFTGKIKCSVISKSPSGKYFASIVVENTEERTRPKQAYKAIGIDLGIKDFLITSEGIKVGNPRYLKASIERLKVLQRRVSKKQKDSANYFKANKKVAVLHERIANQRLDFLHKLSSKIVHDSQVDTICIENLAINQMVRNHKLSQAISDVAWGKFVDMLKYKSEWYGKNLIQINRYFPSSKTCSCCGFINRDLKLSDREWFCVCGAEHDRDLNAAINIRNSGLGKSVVPVKV